jgi:hypothetical protein
MPVSIAHQTEAQQHSMDRAGWQPDTLSPEQHGQLARAPVRVSLAQGTDARLQLRRGLRGRAVRSTAALFDGRYATLTVTRQPQITGWPRNAKLKA